MSETGRAAREARDEIFPPEAYLGEAPCEMRRASPPIARFVGGLLLALFWNGIVSVFVYQTANEWRAGSLPIFSSLFLVPFVFVGLGLCGYVVYAFLALFNPRPRLTLDPGCLVLGGRAHLSWTVEGAVHRIRQLTLTLEGREEATYRRGTDTTTDREVFLRLPLAVRDGHGSIRQGAATFTVPAETMHSFVAPNNKIVWVLRVQGTIRWWPDVSEEFPVGVLPQRELGA